MDGWPAVLFPALVALALSGTACLSQQDYRRWMARAYAPATLVREDLTLSFHPEEVLVRADFFFETTSDSPGMRCLFPGAGWPLAGGAAAFFPKLPVPPRQFAVALDGEPVAVASDEAGNFLFVINFSRQGTRVVTTYRSDYTVDRLGRRLFAYILHTGAYWLGPIGGLHITVETTPGLKVRRLWPERQAGTNVCPEDDLIYTVE
jgi:hypothetical protein